MNRIDALFRRLRSEGRRALMPFITAGDPDLPTTAALIAEMIRQGADMVELGIPYSDPIADGPVISASYHRALTRGIKLDSIFQTLHLPGRGHQPPRPIVTMISYAIIHRTGVERYLREAVAAGVDGLIVPDLPVEESEGLFQKTNDAGLKLIQLVTPTTPRERLACRSPGRPPGSSTTSRSRGSPASAQGDAARAGRERVVAPIADRSADLHRVRDQLARSDPGARARWPTA